MSRRAFTSENHVKSWELLIVPNQRNTKTTQHPREDRTEPNVVASAAAAAAAVCSAKIDFIKILWLQKFGIPGKQSSWINRN